MYSKYTSLLLIPVFFVCACFSSTRIDHSFESIKNDYKKRLISEGSNFIKCETDSLETSFNLVFDVRNQKNENGSINVQVYRGRSLLEIAGIHPLSGREFLFQLDGDKIREEFSGVHYADSAIREIVILSIFILIIKEENGLIDHKLPDNEKRVVCCKSEESSGRRTCRYRLFEKTPNWISFDIEESLDLDPMGGIIIYPEKRDFSYVSRVIVSGL
ncbi:MAG TPA: hypothetical protein PKA63_14330 [Oligoflexia bacterium]|nr:hypothetical protein [Oligoflexia bacterium]HMP49842.1 hypothetical protein [Oligoflexia bacterium]